MMCYTPIQSTPTRYISTVEMYGRCDNIVRKERKRSIEYLFQLELETVKLGLHLRTL